jgi:hypothetical protein
VTAPLALALPFTGRWRTENSPARRVPSHGTHLLGSAYAIDFTGVDDHHRSAARRDWRTVLATEPPERFVGFGRPVLAPAAGTVVAVHDGELDHEARRSQLTLAAYAATQASRLRRGPVGVAGNHVVIAVTGGLFVALAHLRRGSVSVTVGDDLDEGQQVGTCGNSGNSTQPHVHVQAMDSLDLSAARGVPIAFRSFREWRRGDREPVVQELGLPAERSVVEPLPLP